MSEGKIDIEERGPDGLPGIFWLVMQEDMAGIAAWLDAGGDIEASGHFGESPALTAALTDNWPAVLYLLKRGARPGIADTRGITLAYLTSTSRVAIEGRYGQALTQVRAILAERGLLNRIYEPATVRRMRTEGRWPPPEYR